MTATANDSLIPVRALNQITYCERLYYLQYVDCVMPLEVRSVRQQKQRRG